jgi:glutathione synthase/RimK-type ligase-like ATP-grasp enzyme
MPLKIGVFSSQEIFSQTLVDIINEKGYPYGIKAEFIVLPPVTIDEICTYKVIIDRISHLVKFIRSYLKHASLTGTTIINNPFLCSYDDKFYNGTLAKTLGIAVPKTIILPSRTPGYEFRPGDLHNLAYPVDWDGLCNYTGFPAILKPVDGYGWQYVYKVNTMEELLLCYNETGNKLMLLQEFIKFDNYIRCFIFGKKYVLPVRYDPYKKSYIISSEPVKEDLRKRIIEDCIKINKALGYDMNTVEFAIKEGIPYAIDFMNPVPDCDPRSIEEEYFTWVVDKLAEVAIEYALAKV